MSAAPRSDERLPAVSIGLPVWNGQKYLRQSLEALLAQTFSDFELIVSDNGSTDETEAICREYAARDPRIRYIRHSENRGPHFNYNFVLAEARAPYFMWATADDSWNPSFVEALCRCLEADPAAVGAQGEYAIIDGDGHEISAPVANLEMERGSRLGRLLPLAWKSYIGLYVYGLFRTTILRQIGMRTLPFARKLARHAEFPILNYLGAVGTIRTCRDARFLYRLHPEQDSHRRYSVMMSCRLELGLMVAVPASVWKGSHAPLDTLIAFLNIALVRSKFMLGRLIRVPLQLMGVKPRRQPFAS